MGRTSRLQGFEVHLQQKGFSPRTIASYVWVATYYERSYEEVDARWLGEYRAWLLRHCKPVTVNQRIHAINSYLCYLGKEDLRLRSIPVQQQTFLDRMMDDEDYRRLVDYLWTHGYVRDWIAVRLMATTGMRVSELLQLQVEHVQAGSVELCSKGKVRRVYIPTEVRAEVLAWLEREHRSAGQLILNRYGKPISTRGLAQQLKKRAAECGLDERIVHPHAFRHLFARKFLEAGGDLVFLADVLGHSSVDTTRVYLRLTGSQQRDQINRIVSW